MSDSAAVTAPAWSLEADCARLRDLFRRHGFLVRSKDVREVWLRRSKLARSTWLPFPESDEELFEQSIKFLHDFMAEEDDTPSELAELVPHPGLGRPTLVDETDGACEICAGWAATAGQRDEDHQVIVLCNECGERVTGMDRNGGRGIASCVPHHYHVTMVNGSVPGRKSVHSELCMDCAVALRLKVYPPDVKDKHGNFNPTAEYMRSYRG